MMLPGYPSQIAALRESNQPYVLDRCFYHLYIRGIDLLL